MKILLFGSIASGKTTVANIIYKKHPYFKLISIDDFRRNYGDGNMDKEIISQNKFIEQIKGAKNAIIEASGVGKLGDNILKELFDNKEAILIIVFYVSQNIIKERLKTRTWDIPFPDKQNKLNDIIKTINHNIQFGRIQMMWLERPQTTIIQIENSDKKSEDFIIKTINNYLKIYENDTK